MRGRGAAGAPVDLWLGRQTTLGSAFIAVSATNPVENVAMQGPQDLKVTDAEVRSRGFGDLRSAWAPNQLVSTRSPGAKIAGMGETGGQLQFHVNDRFERDKSHSSDELEEAVRSDRVSPNVAGIRT